MLVLAVLSPLSTVSSEGSVALFSCLLPRLVVGVPNGTVDGAAVPQTGLVFFCPLRTSGSGECLPASDLLYDTTGNAGGGEGGLVENKRRQQMGFSMKSDSEQLVVCVCCVCCVCVVCVVCVCVLCVLCVCVCMSVCVCV